MLHNTAAQLTTNDDVFQFTEKQKPDNESGRFEMNQGNYCT